MRNSLIKYITLSWAVVGVFEKDSDFTLTSLQKGSESLEEAVEKYIIGYMAFWHIAYVKKEEMQICTNTEVAQKGIGKIERYVLEHPPVIPLPKFYIVFLNQPHIGCDADSLSDVFCL